MPNAFDIGKYGANFNPIAGGQFVSIQDVLSEFGNVGVEIIQLLPKLLQIFTPAQIIAMIEQALPTLVGILTGPGGILSGFLPSGAGSILQQLVSVFGGNTSAPNLLGELATVIGNPASIITQMTSGTGLLSLLSVINANPPTAIGAGSITTTASNLLVAPLFPPDAVADNPYWLIDPNSSRSADGTGSVMITADGSPHALRSGRTPTDIIAIGAGQTLTASIYGTVQGFSGSGNGAAVELQVAPYDSIGLQDFVLLDSWTPTADVAWPGHQLTGTFTVPDGITGAQFRLGMTQNALTGLFHYDEGGLYQATQLPQTGVAGLPETLLALATRWQSLLDTLATMLSGVPYVGASLTDLAKILTSINPANILGPLGGSSIGADMQSMINALVGGHQGTVVTNASVSDLYNVANQVTNNVPGSDVTTYLIASQTLPIPSWATYIDVVLVGPGQGGENGLGLNGQGGHPGLFAAVMWTRGTHFDNTYTGVAFTQGTPGASGGGVGTPPSAAITGTSLGNHSLTAVAGAGAETLQLPFIGSEKGAGAGLLNFNGKPYKGGDDQNTPGGAGNSPGGAGAGGNGIPPQPGGPGGQPAGWVRFRAAAITGQTSGSDTTGPSLPTSVIVTATSDSLTFTPSGSVDA